MGETTDIILKVLDFSISLGILIYILRVEIKRNKEEKEAFDKKTTSYEARLKEESDRNDELTNKLLDVIEVTTKFNVVNQQLANNSETNRRLDNIAKRIDDIYNKSK